MSLQPTTIKAVFFDFMGTCLDWHSSVVQAFPLSVPGPEASKLALEWRRLYFLENNIRFLQKCSPEDIDITLARTLEVAVNEFSGYKPNIDADARGKLINAWHSQPAWPEVQGAIRKIRDDLGLETFVHANGTTRLQLDLTRSSGLSFDMLFSSQLLGVYKPSPEAYLKALEFVKLKPEEVVLVAAHAYDLRGAQKIGMKTIYINRWTDDINEDKVQLRAEFGSFLENMEGLPNAILDL